jgi:transaldolase
MSTREGTSAPLTAESLKVVEELEKQGCKINWTE